MSFFINGTELLCTKILGAGIIKNIQRKAVNKHLRYGGGDESLLFHKM